MKTNLSKYLAMCVVGVGLAASAQYGGYRPAPPPPNGVRAWDVPGSELREFERRGYMDGVQGAQRDLENHRIWNVNNRDEFRRPHVPGFARNEYREGFEHGYYSAVRHIEGIRGRR